METFDPKDLYIGDKSSFPEKKIGKPVVPPVVGETNAPAPSQGFEIAPEEVYFSPPADPSAIAGLKSFGRAAPTGLAGLAGAAAGSQTGALLGALTGPAAPVAVPALSFLGGIVGAFGSSAATGKAIEYAVPTSETERVNAQLRPFETAAGSTTGGMIGFKPDIGRITGMLSGNSKSYIDALKGAGNMYGFGSGTRFLEATSLPPEQGGVSGVGNILEASFFPKGDRNAWMHDAAMGAFVKSNALGHAFESAGAAAINKPIQAITRPRAVAPGVQADLVAEAQQQPASTTGASPAQAYDPKSLAAHAEALRVAEERRRGTLAAPTGESFMAGVKFGASPQTQASQQQAPVTDAAAVKPAAPVGKPTVEPGTRAAVSVAADGRGIVEHIPAHIPNHEKLDTPSLVLAHGAMEPAQAVNSLIALNAEAHRRSGGRKPSDPAFKEKVMGVTAEVLGNVAKTDQTLAVSTAEGISRMLDKQIFDALNNPQTVYNEAQLHDMLYRKQVVDSIANSLRTGSAPEAYTVAGAQKFAADLIKAKKEAEARQKEATQVAAQQAEAPESSEPASPRKTKNYEVTVGVNENNGQRTVRIEHDVVVQTVNGPKIERGGVTRTLGEKGSTEEADIKKAKMQHADELEGMNKRDEESLPRIEKRIQDETDPTKKAQFELVLASKKQGIEVRKRVIDDLRGSAQAEPIPVASKDVSVDGVDISEVPVKFKTRQWQSDKNSPQGGSAVEREGESPVVEFSGRLIVLRNVNGVQVPFYLSTGGGGKKDVPDGKWYPFFGVADGWLNKIGGKDMATYHGRADLATVARHLDKTLGDIRDRAGKGLFPAIGDKQSFEYINKGLSPVENGTPETRAKLQANIDSLFARLDAAAGKNKKPVAPQEQKPAGAAELQPEAKNASAVANFKKKIAEQIELQKQKPNYYAEPENPEIAAANIAMSSDFPSFRKDPKAHHEAMLALKEAAGLPEDYQFKNYGNYTSAKDFRARNDVRHWKPSEPIGAENPADVKERERLFREDAQRSSEDKKVPKTKKQQAEEDKQSKRAQRLKEFGDEETEHFKRNNPDAPDYVVEAYRTIMSRDNGYGPESQEVRAAREVYDKYRRETNDSVKKVIAHEGVAEYVQTKYDEDGRLESGHIIKLKDGYVLDTYGIMHSSGYDPETNTITVMNDGSAAKIVDDIVKAEDLTERESSRNLKDALDNVLHYENVIKKATDKANKLRGSNKKKDIEYVSKVDAEINRTKEHLKRLKEEAERLKANYKAQFGKKPTVKQAVAKTDDEGDAEFSDRMEIEKEADLKEWKPKLEASIAKLRSGIQNLVSEFRKIPEGDGIPDELYEKHFDITVKHVERLFKGGMTEADIRQNIDDLLKKRKNEGFVDVEELINDAVFSAKPDWVADAEDTGQNKPSPGESEYTGLTVKIDGLTFIKTKLSDHYTIDPESPHPEDGDMYVIDLENKINSKEGDIVQIGIKKSPSDTRFKIEFHEDTGKKRKDGSVLPMWHQSADIIIPESLKTIEEVVAALKKGMLNEHGPDWNKPNKPGKMAKRFKAFLDLAEAHQAKNAQAQQAEQSPEKPTQLGAGRGELLDTSEAFNLTGENVAGQQDKPKDTTGELIAGVEEPAYVSQARTQLAKLEKSGKSPEQQKTLRGLISAYEDAVRPAQEAPKAKEPMPEKKPNTKVTRLLMELDKISAIGDEKDYYGPKESRFYDSRNENSIVNKIIEIREAGGSLDDILNKFGLKKGVGIDAKQIEDYYENSKKRLAEPSKDQAKQGEDTRMFTDELKQTMRGLQFKVAIGTDKKPVFKSPNGMIEVWPSTNASGEISGWNLRQWRRDGVFKFKTFDEAMAKTGYADKSAPTPAKDGKREKGRIDYEGFEYPPESHSGKVQYFKEKIEEYLGRVNKKRKPEDEMTVEEAISSFSNFGKAFPDYREPGDISHKAMLAIKEAFGFPADHRFEDPVSDTEAELKQKRDPRHFKLREMDAQEKREASYRERVENDEVAKGVLEHDYFIQTGGRREIRPTGEIAEAMNVGIKNISRLMQQLVREKLLKAMPGMRVKAVDGSSYTVTYYPADGVTRNELRTRLQEIAATKPVAATEPTEVKGKKGLAMAINRQKTLISEAPNEGTKQLRQKDLARMEAIIDATKERYTDNRRITTVRKKIAELLNDNVFKGMNGGLDFIDSPKVRDLMAALKSYESKVGTVEEQAAAVEKPFGEFEPDDISKARKDLASIIRNMSRGEGWDAKRKSAEDKIAQYEAEQRMMTGEHVPTREELDVISNKALEEFVERFGEGEVSPEVYKTVTGEFTARLEAQDRAEVQTGEKGKAVKGDLIGDIQDIIRESGGSISIPTLPKEFGADELLALRENLGQALAKKLMRNPGRFGKLDLRKAAADKNYRDDVKGAADGMISDLAQALHSRGWTQFDPSKASSDVLKDAILRATKGEMLTPEGGVAGREAKIEDSLETNGKVPRLYDTGSASEDPFSRRDISPEAAKRELERRQAQNAKNREGDPSSRKGYKGVVDRVISEARLRGEINEKETEGLTRILNMIGSEFFEGVKFKFGKGEREGEYGQYEAAERIVKIFKDAIRSGKFEETSAHEIAHHLTRFLPESDRAAIRKELAEKRAKFLKDNEGLSKLLPVDSKDWSKLRFNAQQVADANLSNPTKYLHKLTGEELKRGGYKPGESIYRLKLTDETYRLTSSDEYFAETFKDRVMSRLLSDPVYLGRARNWKERLNGLWETIKINFRRMFGKENADRILSNFAKGRYNPDMEAGYSMEHIGAEYSLRDRKPRAEPIVDTETYDDPVYPVGEVLVRTKDGTRVVNILGRNKMSPERAAQIKDFTKDSSIKHALYRGQNGAYETLDANMSEDGLFHIAADPDYAAQYAEDHSKRLPDGGTESAVVQVYINAKNIVDISDIGHSIESRAKLDKMLANPATRGEAVELIKRRENEFIDKIISEVERINRGKDIDLDGLRPELEEGFEEARDDHINRFKTSVWQVFSHSSIHSLFGKYGVDAIKYSDSDLRTAKGGKIGGQDSYVLADPRRIKAAFGENDVNPESSNIFQSKKDERKPFQQEFPTGENGALSRSMGLERKNSITESEFRQLSKEDPTFRPVEWERVETSEMENIPEALEAQRKAGIKPSDTTSARLNRNVEYRRKQPKMLSEEAEVKAQEYAPTKDLSNSGDAGVMKSVRDASREQSDDPDVFREPRPGQSVARTAWDIASGRYFSGISAKAHQNAERNEYSPTVKQIANMIHSRPGTKSEAYERDMPTAISTTRTKFHNKFNDIMSPLRDTLGGFRDTEAGSARDQREVVYKALVDMITGRREITSGDLGKAAGKLKALLAEVHEYRRAAGENIGEVEDYYPAIYDSPRIGENRKPFIRDAKLAYEIQLAEMGEEGQAKELGMTKAEFADMSQNNGQELKEKLEELAEQRAIALYNSHVRGASAEEFDSIFGMANRSGAENAAMSRKFGRSAQDIMEKWQVKDPFRVVSRYLTSSAKRAEIVRRFGNEGEGWSKLSRQMESDGVSYDTISEMRDLVRSAAGIGVPIRSKASQTYVDTITLMTAASAMGRGFMNNLVEPVTIGMRTGSPIDILRAYGETWSRFLREIPALSPTLRKKMGETFWSEYGHEIGTIHNSLEDAWMTTHSMDIDAEYADPRFRWLTNRVYKANLMDASEVAKQQASHAIGFSYINKLGAMFRGDHWTSKIGLNAKQSVSDQLSELGIKPEDHAAFAEWTKQLEAADDAERMQMMTSMDPMAELHREAMTRFSMQSSVRSSRAHKPVFQDTDLGKTVLQLMNFSYSYAAEVNSRMYNMSKQAFWMSPDGKNYSMYDRLRMMGPAAGGMLSILAYRGLLELKDLLYPSESAAQRAKDPAVVKWTNATSYAGLLGPKFEQVVKAVKRDQAPGGPAGQMLVNVGRAGKSVIESVAEGKDMSSAKKSAAKAAIPIIKGGAVAGAAAINPALGTVATQITNSPQFRDALTPGEGDKYTAKELTPKPLNPKK